MAKIPSNQAVPGEVSVSDIIQALINFNSTMLSRFIGLLEKIEADLLSAGNSRLQGEAEELLRMILDTASKSIDSLLALQQQLQTRIIESYFPAQD